MLLSPLSSESRKSGQADRPATLPLGGRIAASAAFFQTPPKSVSHTSYRWVQSTGDGAELPSLSGLKPGRSGLSLQDVPWRGCQHLPTFLPRSALATCWGTSLREAGAGRDLAPPLWPLLVTQVAGWFATLDFSLPQFFRAGTGPRWRIQQVTKPPSAHHRHRALLGLRYKLCSGPSLSHGGASKPLSCCRCFGDAAAEPGDSIRTRCMAILFGRCADGHGGIRMGHGTLALSAARQAVLD